MIEEPKRNPFARKWPEPPAPYVLPAPVVPRVRMAVPPPGSIPLEAQRLADAFVEAGFSVRLTYGVCGHDHRSPDRGQCAVCDYVDELTIEGGMPKHVATGKHCAGAGMVPLEIIEFTEKGKIKRQGVCPTCDESVRLTVNGNIYKHGPTCEGTAGHPSKMILGEKLPPEESIALRVKKFGTGCWTDGKYDFGGIIRDKRIVIVKVTEWKREARAAISAGARSA